MHRLRAVLDVFDAMSCNTVAVVVVVDDAGTGRCEHTKRIA